MAGQGPQPPAAPPCGQLASLCGSGLGGPGASALRPVSTLLCTVVLSKLAALAWSLLHLVAVRQAAGMSRLSPRGGAVPSGAQSSVSRGQPGACHRSGLGPLQETAWSVPCWPSGAGSRRGLARQPLAPGGAQGPLPPPRGQDGDGRRACWSPEDGLWFEPLWLPGPGASVLLPVRGGCRAGRTRACRPGQRGASPVLGLRSPAARGTRRSLRTVTPWGWWPQRPPLQ